jgi:hypothetical protein
VPPAHRPKVHVVTDVLPRSRGSLPRMTVASPRSVIEISPLRLTTGRVRDRRLVTARSHISTLRTARSSSDSAEGYRHKGHAISMAKKLNPNAELVIDDAPQC